MTYWFTGIGALFVAEGWLYQQGFSKLISVPLLLGSILSFVSLFLDLRHGEILQKCYEIGESLECKLRGDEGAIFKSIRSAHTARQFTYTRSLRVAYLMIGSLLFIFSIGALCHPIR